MEFNVVVLSGVLSADPEHRTFDSGASLLRCLVTVRSESPRRVDVIPITLWDPSEQVLNEISRRGQRVWVAGMVQRRFWAAADGRESRIEIVARAIELSNDDRHDLAIRRWVSGGSVVEPH